MSGVPLRRVKAVVGRLVVATSALATGAGCGASHPFEPDQLADVRIDVDVGGGVAGVQYSFRVEGRQVVGLRCTLHCPLEEGEVGLALSEGQWAELADRLVSSGIAAVGAHDYGFSCCDQFTYRIRYRDGIRTSDVTGDAETFPDGLAELAGRLTALAHGTVPARVRPDLARDQLIGDPFSIDSLTVGGTHLTVFARHDGGCATHTFDLVFVEGWMESFPVQVRAVVAHDDRDDPCDAAALPRTLEFDLRPLVEAYRDAYGTGTSGHRIVVRLAAPGDGSGERSFEVVVP